MTNTGETKRTAGVLVSDFDGTMTCHDFYQLAIESLLPADVPDDWVCVGSDAGSVRHETKTLETKP